MTDTAVSTNFAARLTSTITESRQAVTASSAETQSMSSVDTVTPRAQSTGQSLMFNVQLSEGVVYVHTQLPKQRSAEEKFRTLAEQWYQDTLFSSSYLDKILHPSYQKILTLGEPAIPLILAELRDMPNDWFWALRVLSDADPVTSEQAGNMQAMADAWLRWGRGKGYAV